MIEEIAKTSCRCCESRPGFLNASLITSLVENTIVFDYILSPLKTFDKDLISEFRLQR